MEPQIDLIDWAINYIDYLNTFRSNLLKKNIKENIIDCEYKDKGNAKYVIIDEFDESIFNYFETDNLIIICLNKKSNMNFVISYWDKFIKNQKLKIIFSNPKINQQWSIIPYVHDKFNDSDGLKNGLNSLFSNVPSV